MVMAGALKPGSSEYPRYSRAAPSLYGDDYLLELCGWSDFASFGLTPRSRLLAICAEPNLGASDVITDILLRVPLPGAKVFRRSLLGHDPDSAAAALVRLARSVSKAPSPAVVAIDDIPSSDEPDALRQANALRRMWEAGALVVFSLPPEAGQLLSFLPECSVVSSRGLLIQSVVDHGASARSKLLWRLSFGIPDLVRLLEPVPNDDLERSLPSHSYGDALSRHLSLSLRRSLTDEELRVRLCMVLLGSGAFEDLSLALDGPCDEMLSHISSVAPFFSVDHSRRSFLTLLTDEALALPGPLARLEATSALFPDVVANSLRLILERGSFLRAVRLFALPGGSGAYGHALRFGASLLDAGGAGVVASALEERLGSCRTEDRSQALSSAVSAVCGEDVGWAALEKYRDRVIKEEGVRDALMFVDAREALRGRRPLVAYAELEWSGLGRRLLVHREAVGLMAGGRPSAAMRLLLANPCGPRIETVSSALLCLDQEVARLLLCDDGGRSETLVERSVEILRSSQARGLTGYADCAMALRAALRPAGNASHIESALSRAEKSGDTVVQAVSLAAGCVYDLRSGAFPRASVRSTLAVVIARRAGLDYVARVSRLLGEAARFLMGDLSEGDAVDGSPDELGEICRFAHDVMRADRDLGSLEDEHGAKLPVDTLWLLVVLSECLGDFSGLFEKMLPASWRYAVSAARSGKEEAALRVCREKVLKHKLNMKLVTAHFLLGEPKVIFFFTAEERVDFRDLVKDLVSVFRMRIELRQIGVRDESRLIGGLSVCGRDYCCHSITSQLEPVTIKMAKEQNLSLNSMKISGPCGRLLCCLAYEYDYYLEEKASCPPEGTRLRLGRDLWKVTEVNILSHKLTVQASEGQTMFIPFTEVSYNDETGYWDVSEEFQEDFLE